MIRRLKSSIRPLPWSAPDRAYRPTIERQQKLIDETFNELTNWRGNRGKQQDTTKNG
jgi:hypothetical protein